MRQGSVSAMAWLLLFVTRLPCHAGMRVSSRHDRRQRPKRTLSDNNIFTAQGQVQKDVTIVYVNYTNFFDDDAYIKKIIALPPFRITLELVNTYGISSSDLALDLNPILYGYLSDKISLSLPTISSLSLDVSPVHSNRRSLVRVKGQHFDLRRHRNLSSTTSSFDISGNATFLSGNAATLTEQVRNSTVSAMSNSTSVLNVIQTQSTNSALKNVAGVYTSIDGLSFSKVNTIDTPQTTSKTPVSLTLALGCGAIGLAGLGVLIAVFIFSRRSWKRKQLSQGHKSIYQNQAKATYTDIRSSRTKRVQFNQDANTIRTIASPTSTNNSFSDVESPANSNSNSNNNITSDEDVIDLILTNQREKTAWGHVDEIAEGDKVSGGCMADLKSLPSPTTLTHQGFLDFLFGRPNANSLPDFSPIRIIGEDDPPQEKKREVLVFETSKWSPSLAEPDVNPKPELKKKVTPISAIENLTFVSKFQIEARHDDFKPMDVPILLPQCVTNFSQAPSPARACYESKPAAGLYPKTSDDNSKENSDLSSVLSSESSSLGLDSVEFIRQTMEGHELNGKQHLLKDHEISDDEVPFDQKQTNRVKISSYSAVLGSPSNGPRNHTNHRHVKAEILKDNRNSRQMIPLTAVVDVARSPEHGLNKRNMIENSLLGSECDDDTEIYSDEDDGAIGYAKDRNESPRVTSTERYEHGVIKDLGRLGANPVVNNSLLTLYDDEDVVVMDASYDDNVNDGRTHNPSRKTSDFVSEVKQYQRKKSRYDSILDLYEVNPSDHESGPDRYFSKQLASSHNMKSSPKRRNEDGSFPRPE